MQSNFYLHSFTTQQDLKTLQQWVPCRYITNIHALCLVPKPRGGKEVKIFVEKAVNTVHIKRKEVSGAHGYKGHCRLLVSPDRKVKALTL